MRKLLVPVDGSPVANRAVAYAIGLARCVADTRIVLLNVQQNVEHWHKRGLLDEESMKELRQQGEQESREARAALDAAGALYDFHIAFGHPAEVIVRMAREERCEGVVMGTRGLGDVETLILGSTAYKVIQLAQVPVTLVK
ncbi:MAG: universal stress protein [Betaproteobacteria bacterium]|nr:universal stress protein [Betaproteobacteria bacterium]